jgi:hypothetical protein
MLVLCQGAERPRVSLLTLILFAWVSRFETSIADCSSRSSSLSAGAVALLLYNVSFFIIDSYLSNNLSPFSSCSTQNVPGAAGVSADLGGVVIPEAGLTFEDGVAIVAAVAAEPTVTISESLALFDLTTTNSG